MRQRAAVCQQVTSQLLHGLRTCGGGFGSRTSAGTVLTCGAEGTLEAKYAPPTAGSPRHTSYHPGSVALMLRADVIFKANPISLFINQFLSDVQSLTSKATVTKVLVSGWLQHPFQPLPCLPPCLSPFLAENPLSLPGFQSYLFLERPPPSFCFLCPVR